MDIPEASGRRRSTTRSSTTSTGGSAKCPATPAGRSGSADSIESASVTDISDRNVRLSARRKESSPDHKEQPVSEESSVRSAVSEQFSASRTPGHPSVKSRRTRTRKGRGTRSGATQGSARQTAPQQSRKTPSKPSTPVASDRSGDREEALTVGDIDLSRFELSDLEQLVNDTVEEIKRRRLEEQDVSSLIDYGFQNCFTLQGDATSPVVVNGMVIVPGSVKVRNQKGDHDCNLYVARIAGEDRWVWDFTEHLAGSKTFKDGDLRRTVTVFPAISGMILFGHDRRRANSKNSLWPVHTYKTGGATALKLVMDTDTEGRFEIAPPTDLRNLPLPSGIEDGD